MSATQWRFKWRSWSQRRSARACAHCRSLVAEVDMVGHARWHREHARQHGDGPTGFINPSVTVGRQDRLVVLDGEAAEVRET